MSSFPPFSGFYVESEDKYVVLNYEKKYVEVWEDVAPIGYILPDYQIIFTYSSEEEEPEWMYCCDEGDLWVALAYFWKDLKEESSNVV